MRVLFFTTVVALALISTVYNAAIQGNVSYTEANIDAIFDEMLVNLRKDLKEKDPLSLPNASDGFSKKIIFVTVRGGAQVYNGKLYGLTSLKRSGPCTVSYENKNLKLKADLQINNLKAEYSASAHFMAIKVGASATVKISSVRAQLVAEGTTDKLQLKQLNILDIGGFSLSISGLGPLGWALGGLTTGLGNILKKIIAGAIQNPIKNAINKEIGNLKLPFN